MRIETERLILRPFRPDDAAKLYANHAEPELRRWIPNECYSDEREAAEAAAFFAGCAAGGGLPLVLAVEWKETGDLIGDVGLNEVEGRPGEIEIGFSICRGYAGRSAAAEAALAMERCACGLTESGFLWGRVLKGNAASERVLSKAGYERTGMEENAPDDPYGNGMVVFRKRIRP